MYTFPYTSFTVTGIVLTPVVIVFRQEMVASINSGSIAYSLLNPNALKSAVAAATSNSVISSPSAGLYLTVNTLLSL